MFHLPNWTVGISFVVIFVVYVLFLYFFPPCVYTVCGTSINVKNRVVSCKRVHRGLQNKLMTLFWKNLVEDEHCHKSYATNKLSTQNNLG